MSKGEQLPVVPSPSCADGHVVFLRVLASWGLFHETIPQSLYPLLYQEERERLLSRQTERQSNLLQCTLEKWFHVLLSHQEAC